MSPKATSEGPKCDRELRADEPVFPNMTVFALSRVCPLGPVRIFVTRVAFRVFPSLFVTLARSDDPLCDNNPESQERLMRFSHLPDLNSGSEPAV